MSNVLKLEKLPKEESLLLQGEEHSTNTALVVSNKDGAQIVAYVLKDGRVIDEPEFQTFENQLSDSRFFNPREKPFGNFTLLVETDQNLNNKYINKFNSVEQVNNFLKKYFNKEIDMEEFESIASFDGIYSETYKDDCKIHLKIQNFFESDDVFRNKLKIIDLTKENTYRGLRYNGVDYDCTQVICGINQYNAEVLGFVCNDGEIININDSLLDGVFLIENDENKKFDTNYLISPFEVTPHIEEIEENFTDEEQKHAFKRWDITIQDLDGKIEFYNFSTHNDMFSFLCEKFKELPTQRIPDYDSQTINPIIFKENGEYYNIEFFKNDFNLTMDSALKRKINEAKQTTKARSI